MKTIEECIYKYVNEAWGDTSYEDEVTKGMIGGYVTKGVELAQIWIPIEKEGLPMNETILVKMEGLIVGIGIFSKEISIINGQYADSMPKVTHWRPINYI